MKIDSNSSLPIIHLSEESLRRMQELVDNPPPPSPELRAAYERYKEYCANLSKFAKHNKDKS